ncbi:MAG: dihydrolipoamide acetyltransferase family protein [Candidatus Methylomirabilia bacterium]
MGKQFKLPDLGEGLTEAEIVRILVSEGEDVKEDQVLLLVETEKAQVELPSPYGGRVSQIHVQPGERVKVGTVLFTFDEVGKAAAPRPKPAPVPTAPPRVEPAARCPGAPAPATPVTRRLARELGVDLARVNGTGPGGRITDEDVRAAAGIAAAAAEAPAPARPEAPPEALEAFPLRLPLPPLPRFEQWGPVEREALRAVRRRSAEHMALAWALIPHVTHFDQADLTDLEAFRRRHQRLAQTWGADLTLTLFLVKAAAVALQAYPRLNASLDHERGELILKRYYHIGVAVETERGLIVPVIRDVDRKRIKELAVELTDLVTRTREGSVTVEELRGGTFTVTNVGVSGGIGATPIINYPEVVILGVGRAQEQPVVREGQIVARLMLPLCLSFDHRALDGADAARFVRALVQILEDPGRLLLEA